MEERRDDPSQVVIGHRDPEEPHRGERTRGRLGRIDAHVAAVMAHHTLLRNPGRSVYEEREAIIV